MNTEIEIKIFEIEKEDLITKLEDLGAKKILDSDINDWYYALDIEKHEFLRIREAGEKTMFTYKIRLHHDGMQVNKEIELEIEDAQKMIQIIGAIGIEQYDILRIRHRTSYTLPGVRFDFDKYPKIPRFMEIEASNEQTVNERIQKLGLENNPTSGLGYDDFVDDYKGFIGRIK